MEVFPGNHTKSKKPGIHGIKLCIPGGGDSGSFIQQVFSMLQTGKAKKSTQDRRTKRKSHKDMLQSILDET